MQITSDCFYKKVHLDTICYTSCIFLDVLLHCKAKLFQFYDNYGKYSRALISIFFSVIVHNNMNVDFYFEKSVIIAVLSNKFEYWLIFAGPNEICRQS